MSYIHIFSCFPQHLCYGSPFLLPMSVSCLLVGNDLFGPPVPPEPRYCCVAPWLDASWLVGWLVGCCVVPGRQAGLLLCCTWLAGWLAGWVAGWMCLAVVPCTVPVPRLEPHRPSAACKRALSTHTNKTSDMTSSRISNMSKGIAPERPSKLGPNRANVTSEQCSS
jgi:hypothetical protein